MKTIGLATALAFLLAMPAKAENQGSADEAKAMLLRAVEAIKVDRDGALAMIATGEGGFLDGDLYAFCFNLSDGLIHPFANPNSTAVFGKDERDIVDANGKAFGLEIYTAAQKPEGEITEVRYVWAKPGSDTTPLPKVALVTRADDLGCGVGHYE